MALLSDTFKRFTRPQNMPMAEEERTLASATVKMHFHMQQSVSMARDIAAHRAAEAQKTLGRPLTQEEIYGIAMPRLTDIYAACVKIGVAEGLDPKEWNPKAFANLSGQQLNGFLINEPKKGAPEIAKNFDAYDLDGNHQIDVAPINAFYDNIALDGAKLHHCFVDPATSFNDQIAKAGEVDHVTFNNMTDRHEPFVFGSGQYKHIAMTNVKGGHIQFDEHTQVEHLSISGLKAGITIGAHASVSHMSTSEEFRILELQMGPGSRLAHSNLENATISMKSHLKGATFDRVHLSENIDHGDWSDVTLKDVTIGGKAIETLEDLKAFAARHQITLNEKTKVIATETFLKEMKQAKAEKEIEKAGLLTGELSWVNDLKKPAPAPEAPKPHAPKIEAPAIDPAKAITLTAGIEHAQVGFDGSYEKFMNADLTKLPKAPPENTAVTHAMANLEALKAFTEKDEHKEALKNNTQSFEGSEKLIAATLRNRALEAERTSKPSLPSLPPLPGGRRV